MLLYSSPHDDIAHTAVQLQLKQLCVVVLIVKLYCSGRLGEVHSGNGCSYRNGATVALSAEHCGVQYSDRLLFYVFHKLFDTERCVASNTVTME